MDGSRFDGWTRRRFGLAAGGAVTALLGLAGRRDAAAKHGNKHHHKHKHGEATKANLEEVGGSGISGFVTLHSLGKGKGTSITVHADGLTPDTEYESLYYDNDQCDLEPYSAEDVIGGTYFPNPDGIGHTSGDADDDLDEIHSVSVRLAEDFSLQACAKVSAV